MLALLNAAAVQVSNGGNSVLPLEGVGQIVFVQVGKLCQQVQRDILAVVGVQIPLDLHTLPAVGAGRFLYLQRKRGTPHQPDEQHFQKILTDRFAAVQTAVCFGQQHVQQRHHPLPIFPAVEYGVGRI